jgi:hypothetical protein
MQGGAGIVACPQGVRATGSSRFLSANQKATGALHPRLWSKTKAFRRTLGSLADERQARANSDDKDLGCHAAPPFEEIQKKHKTNWRQA